MATTTRRTAAKLHLLTVKQVQHARDGDHSDGGGLLLQVRGSSVSWVFRYTAPSGRRREMGLGIGHRGSPGQAGDALTGARGAAHKARDLLRAGSDPLEAKAAHREATRQAEDARKATKAREHWTLARCARDYHERVIEPARTTKHAAQYIANLENHIPASLWHRSITEIDPPELLRALAEIKPQERSRNLSQGDRVAETVQRIRQRLDAIFEDAIVLKRCTTNPAAAVCRKIRESLPKKKAGQFKALPYREAAALMVRLRAAPDTAARSLEFAVLSGASSGQVSTAVGRSAWPSKER